MGCGKSTAGRKLAARLGWSFTDLDRQIEKNAGKTITRIFSDEGETRFRELEADALRSPDLTADTVISTGGGTPCFSGNMDFMLETGTTIYLKMTPGQLTKRLLNSTSERPLIKNIPDEKLQTFIEEKLHLREKWYERAEIIVYYDNLDFQSLYSLIKKNLDQ